jgi:RHS repeat-associated protein
LGCLKLPYQSVLKVHEPKYFLVKSAVEKNDHEQKKGVSSFTFGFQGQEGDNEVNGEGNSYAFKYRIHDPRLGRFLSTDPLTAKYPFYSPYAFSGNRVMDMIELEGLEPTTPKSQWKTSFIGTYEHGLMYLVNNKYYVFEQTTDGSSEIMHTPKYQFLPLDYSGHKWEVFDLVPEPSAVDELVSIPVKLTKPIWNNLGLESKVTATLGVGKADVIRILGFGAGDKSFIGMDVAEYNIVDGFIAITQGEVPITPLEVPLNLQYSYQRAKGPNSFSAKASFSPKENGTFDLSLSGSSYGVGLEASAYKAVGILPGAQEASSTFFPSESFYATYSILDLSKNYSTGKGYDVMINTTVDLKLNLKGFIKDVQEQYKF